MRQHSSDGGAGVAGNQRPEAAADPPAEQRCQTSYDHGLGDGEQEDLPAPRTEAR